MFCFPNKQKSKHLKNLYRKHLKSITLDINTLDNSTKISFKCLTLRIWFDLKSSELKFFFWFWVNFIFIGKFYKKKLYDEYLGNSLYVVQELRLSCIRLCHSGKYKKKHWCELSCTCKFVSNTIAKMFHKKFLYA